MLKYSSALQTESFIRKVGTDHNPSLLCLSGSSPPCAAVSRYHLHLVSVQVSLGFRGGGASPAVYTCSSLFSYVPFEHLIRGYHTRYIEFCDANHNLPFLLCLCSYIAVSALASSASTVKVESRSTGMIPRLNDRA